MEVAPVASADWSMGMTAPPLPKAARCRFEGESTTGMGAAPSTNV